jgi:RimJ/RimL family protein N-acetyltransferase
MLIVREVQPTYLEDLFECYNSYYEELKENAALGLPASAGKPTMSGELEWFSSLSKKIAEGNTIAIVAEVGSHVVGMCEVSRALPSPEVAHRGNLGLAIRKEHREKGVGTALLKFTLDKCKGKFEIVELSVFSSNDAAKRLYSKFGFKAIGVRPRSIKRGDGYIDEDIMILTL